MKHLLIFFLFIMNVTNISAQMVTGYFYQEDDGDIYYITTNQAIDFNPYYGQYPMTLVNADFLIYRNGKCIQSFTLSQGWSYNTSIAIGPELEIYFDKGDIIKIYVNGNMQISSICPYKSSSLIDKILQSSKGRKVIGKTAKELGKAILKVAKKIR